MNIFGEITKTVKNIFNADEDMMFEDENEFQESSKQGSFTLPKAFSKKTGNASQNKPQEFNLGNHSFDVARNTQTQKTKSNGKIQVYVPKTFEEAFPIIKSVKSGFTAMVNVEVANPQVAQRLIDVISGAIYALDGDSKKMGEKQYIFSLSADTVGAYDFLPTSGMMGQNQNMPGMNYGMPAGFDFNNNPAQAFNQNFGQPQNFGQTQNFGQNQNFGQGMNYGQNNFNQQQGFNFNQNAEKITQDLQSFYQPPKSQF